MYRTKAAYIFGGLFVCDRLIAIKFHLSSVVSTSTHTRDSQLNFCHTRDSEEFGLHLTFVVCLLEEKREFFFMEFHRRARKK